MNPLLNKNQLGRYGEYFVKMEFTRLGLDVYSPEVDDKGIDCIVRTSTGRFFEIQVKSARGNSLITLPRKTRGFTRRDSLFAAVAWFPQASGVCVPKLFLIPSTDFPEQPGKQPLPSLLGYYKREHEEKGKSFDEYQLRTSPRNIDELQSRYSFECVAAKLLT